jgi:hypothetical protein
MLDTQTSALTKSWCLYQYDPALGFVEAFPDPFFGKGTDGKLNGNRALLFPSRFPINELRPMKSRPNGATGGYNWKISDKISSFRWDKLDTAAYFSFFRTPAGLGVPFYDINGRVVANDGSQSIPNLAVYSGIDGSISSFKWSLAPPLSIKVNSVTVPDASVAIKQNALSKTIMVNHLYVESVVTVGLDQSWTKRTSVTRTTSSTNAREYSVELTVGTEGIGYSASLKVGFKQSSSTTKETSLTEETEETIAISESHEVTLNPSQSGVFKITVACDIIEVQPTPMRFVVTKTYDFFVKGGEQIAGTNLWVRKENIDLTVAGNMRSASEVTTKKLA